MNTKPKTIKTGVCKNCDKSFEYTRGASEPGRERVFCSNECRFEGQRFYERHSSSVNGFKKIGSYLIPYGFKTLDEYLSFRRRLDLIEAD